jgi:hypothetical protein
MSGVLISAEARNRVKQSDDGRVAAVYHRVYAKEGFADAAQRLFRLVREAQRVSPGAARVLYLDIDAHRNRDGNFDPDMLKLHQHFIRAS